MRVRIEVNTRNATDKEGEFIIEQTNFEAQSILFTQTQEKFKTTIDGEGEGGLHIMTLADGLRELESYYKQVPALIVLLDTGEYRVQPLVIDNGEVRVFDVEMADPRTKLMQAVNDAAKIVVPETISSLPVYKSHKLVGAFKIHLIEMGALYSEGNEFLLGVSKAYMQKHKPYAGGYYVRYEDGYESFSPAEAFEAGYTPVLA
jgi:hypothetical protein